MAGGGQKRSADNPRPKGVGLPESRTEIENLQSSSRRCNLMNVRPAAWNVVKNRPHSNQRSSNINQGLHDICPNHGCQPAFKRVDKGQNCDDCYRSNLPSTEGD